MDNSDALWVYRFNQHRLPMMQGRIALGTGGLAVTVKVNGYFREAPEAFVPDFCKKHSFIVCRLACMLVDAIRGRGVTDLMRMHLSGECIKRIEFMWQLMESYEHVCHGRRADAQLKRLPTIPRWMEVALVTDERIEYNVNVNVGRSIYHSSIVFRKQASKWVAVLADVG